MKKYLLGKTGPIEHWVHIGPDGLKMVLVDKLSGESIQQTLDQNAHAQNHGVRRGDAVLGAQIPITLHHHWRQEWREKARRVMSWQEFLKRKLNSREYSRLRAGIQRF